MEWWGSLLLLLGSLLLLMAAGLPVAFCFALVNVVAVFLLWGGEVGFGQLMLSVRASVTSFTMLPLPLFILLGELMWHSGLALRALDVLEQWLGSLPGRLSLLAVAGGTLFSTLTGASIATIAMLGSTLVPEMEKRGYKRSMSIGPILGSGGLAIMIPPSDLAVLLCAIGRISIGKTLIAIIIPGLLMSALYTTYIMIRCRLQPSIAPAYAVTTVRLLDKLLASIVHIVPLGIIIFFIIGLIFLGVATPTEAAALGAVAALLIAFLFRRLSWDVLKKSLAETLSITVMMFMIMTGAIAFSQILAYTGVSSGVAESLLGLALPPILILVTMQVILIIMGMFIELLAVMMIAIPIFMPIVLALGFDPVWFAVIFLLNMEMATTSPPFGLALFVMKSVAPRDVTIGEIYKAGLPFLCCDAVAMGLIMAFPAIALWLPGVMH